VSLSGIAAVGVGAALTPLAVWENRFATPNVQQQAGQTIVCTGVYRLIRHPIYLGNLLLTAGTSLWLGSYASLWGFAVLLLATIGRIAIEERDLRARAPEYAAYAKQVPARLIPFVI
jgi:protein-S-isoprenylcysteine O-methyltransferase Ste14